MEQAANEAEASKSLEEIHNIIIQNKGAINELVALTQAVRGKYTLDSYQVYNIKYQEKERIHEEKLRAATKVVRKHLRNLAKESDPDFIDEGEEESDT